MRLGRFGEYILNRANNMSKSKFLFLALVAVIGSCVAALAVYGVVTGGLPWGHKRSSADVKAANEIHLQNAERKAVEAVGRRASEFSSFIDSKKIGAKPFSLDIVSFYGKWRALKSKLPWTDKDGHRDYVIEKFNEHIFSAQELSNAIKRSIEGGIKDIELIENNLAVSLRQELLGRSLAPSEVSTAEAEFRKSVDTLLAASNKDVAMATGNLVVSEVTAQLATQLLIRLGVSAGILATGVANSWWSFGGAFVIGALVDVIWEWFSKPAESIERVMVAQLDQLSLKGSSSIRDDLTKVANARSVLWREAAKGAL